MVNTSWCGPAALPRQGPIDAFLPRSGGFPALQPRRHLLGAENATSGVRQKHLRAARPTENASETPAGRQADGKFTLHSRFEFFFIIMK